MSAITVRDFITKDEDRYISSLSIADLCARIGKLDLAPIHVLRE